MDPAEEIEQAAFALQKPMNDVIERGDSSVQQFYRDATVFVTGGSGFIGKQLIEKLFRSCAIKKLYIIIRSRSGKTIQERLNQALKDPVYDTLRKKQPDFADKIVPVEGDVADIRLGLSEKDWERIAEDVNVIFHVAATVRFDEPIRKATLTNIRSTREVLALARDCQNLTKFVHVSTAFVHATEERIGKDLEERFYPCPVPPETMIALAEEVDQGRLDAITKDLIGTWPNTYTFTKAISEELIRTTAGDLPVCIVRPSIVLPAYYEPSPGWTDVRTIMGPSGIYLGAGMGVIHVFCTDVDSPLAVAPVDYVNNAIIAAAWDSTVSPQADSKIPVYTISRDLRYGYIGETVRERKHLLCSPAAIWLTETIEVKNPYLFTFLSWFLHYIPAYIIDLLLYITKKKPKEITSFVDVYAKLDKLALAYQYFTRNSWNFKTDNLQAMFARMSDTDKAIFNCDFSKVDLIDYILVWGIGLRKYIVKDGLKGTLAGYRKQKIFRVANYFVMTLYIYSIWWVCKSIFMFISNILI
ncbi:fatty acyl-CoA reductase wat-like [Anticarsia gemmatalis]|uniref:fatty acyl-CoA reductase wat-like n=1 Tax=Anticarsia gemmatalis TaxID=129554 RepID=UPI003F75CDC7